MSDDYTSNIDGLAAKIQAAIESFGFRSHAAEGGTVGDACAEAVAEDIASSAVDLQQTPDGHEFPDNTDAYAKFKDRKYGRSGRAYGIRTGQTFSVESLKGHVEMSDEDLKMRYGTGKPPSRAVGGSGYLSPSDQQTADVEKAYYLTNTMPKPIDFYKVGPYAEKEIKAIQAQSLQAHIKDKTGG